MTTERYYVVSFDVTDEIVTLFNRIGQRVDGQDVWDCWLEDDQRDMLQQALDAEGGIGKILTYVEPLCIPRFVSPFEGFEMLQKYFGPDWCNELRMRL